MRLRGRRAAVRIQEALARQLLQLPDGICHADGHIIKGRFDGRGGFTTCHKSVDAIGLPLD